MRECVAVLLEVGEGAADGHLARACAGLREGEAHDQLFGLDVQAGLRAAVELDALLDDRVGRVVQELQEERAAIEGLLK